MPPAPPAPTARPGPARAARRLRDGQRPRDGQRSRVYRAEDAWGQRLDAARRGASLARVAGSEVVLPAERRFGGLAAAETYCRGVLAHPDVIASVGVLDVPRLRTRAGGRAAHWEPPGVIAIHVPRHGEPWALRETVLLHELAHHLGDRTGLTPHHASPFGALVLLLTTAALGDQAAFALRVAYGEAGVDVGVLG